MSLLLLASLGCQEPPDPTKSGEEDTGEAAGSAGCGAPTELAAGGVQRTVDAGEAGGGERGYWLSLPEDYDPSVPHAVVVGYPGTNWVGEQIQPYLDLERHASKPTIFVYPDPLWREFDGWGTYGGWVLGPHADPADGDEDLVFTATLLDALEAEFCVDTAAVSVTGHSWGGDMAAVVGCFLGDRVTATAPVAANEPYWFDAPGFSCAGQAAVWTWFGVADDHFTWQEYPGEFGDLQDAFWAEANACGDGETTLDVAPEDACVAHEGCVADTRYCLYGPDSAHQAPASYASTTMAWFESF